MNPPANHSGPRFARGRVRQQQGSASRAAAARCVTAVEQGHSLQECFPRETRDLDPRDSALVREISWGTLRHRRLLNEALKPLLRHSIREEFAPARALLPCGLYQLCFTRMPAHAVVAATVGACALCRCTPLSGLVNAVLRQFLRNGARLPEPDEPAIRHSFPDWLGKKLTADYPEEALEGILAASNGHPPLWLRVNTSRIRAEDYVERLKAAGIACTVHPHCPQALLIHDPRPAADFPGFAEGLFCVQDLSAQQIAPQLAAGPGMRILDACAAPGGKSAHLRDLCPDCDLTLMDVSAERLQSARELFARLQFKASFVAGDAADPAALSGEYDRILVDAPCSGTGVIRRHPDIKWLRRAQDIPALAATTAAILDNCFAHLKEGGIMVFSTCSILREENELQLDAFGKRHPEAVPLTVTHDGQDRDFVQILPSDNGGDGFFYCRFGKRGASA